MNSREERIAKRAARESAQIAPVVPVVQTQTQDYSKPLPAIFGASKRGRKGADPDTATHAAIVAFQALRTDMLTVTSEETAQVVLAKHSLKVQSWTNGPLSGQSKGPVESLRRALATKAETVRRAACRASESARAEASAVLTACGIGGVRAK